MTIASLAPGSPRVPLIESDFDVLGSILAAGLVVKGAINKE